VSTVENSGPETTGSPRGSSDTTRTHAAEVYDRVEESAEFAELRRKFRNFAFPMTALFLAWYLLYVIMSGWARDFMGEKVWGNINVAYIFGLLQFASTFLIAWVYWRHAGKNLDPLADKIRHDIEDEGVR